MLEKNVLSSEIVVRRGNKYLTANDILRLRVHSLLKCTIEVKGEPVSLEAVESEAVRFVWRGADYHRRYQHEDPAVKLLEGVYELSQRFYSHGENSGFVF